MKILIALFILLFPSSVFAEKLSDYEIEGISIGDSLLEHFSLEIINDNLSFDYYTHKKNPLKFIVFGISKNESFIKHFDRIEVTFKSDDSAFIVHSLNAGFFIDDRNQCLKIMMEYLQDLRKKFPSLEKSEIRTLDHSADPTGDSEVTEVEFYFNDGDLDLECYDWSENITKSKGFYDNFQVSAQSNEFVTYLFED